jgi:hypothetical protein
MTRRKTVSFSRSAHKVPSPGRSRRRTATNTRAPSLLTGLIYDETGDRLCPTHATKIRAPLPLSGGKIGSAREIAHRSGIDAGAVSRTIRLAFLAPDIVAAILAGRQPVALMPRRLMRIGEMPLEWHRQRRLLGFPA